MLEASLVRGLTESGIDAVLVGEGPSPMLYFATYYLDVDGGIQVTGSHNPANYNGFKLLLKGRSVFGQEIQGIGQRAAGRRLERGRRKPDRRGRHPRSLCRTGCSKDSRARPFRIGWDAGNGAAGPILDMLVERLPGAHFTIFTEVDGIFQTITPTRRSRRISPISNASSSTSSWISELRSTAMATGSARWMARAE